MSRFTERHLDPASRLGEILFGFIMVLTVTLTAGISVADGKRGVRQLLLAAVGSNVAWGIIDAAMYIMNSMVVRRGKVRLVEAAQRAPDQETALVLIQDRVEPELQELVGPEKAEAFSRSVLKRPRAVLVTIAGLAVCESLGATETGAPSERLRRLRRHRRGPVNKLPR